MLAAHQARAEQADQLAEELQDAAACWHPGLPELTAKLAEVTEVSASALRAGSRSACNVSMESAVTGAAWRAGACPQHPAEV